MENSFLIRSLTEVYSVLNRSTQIKYKFIPLRRIAAAAFHIRTRSLLTVIVPSDATSNIPCKKSRHITNQLF
jgi:hypothetical protein